MFLGILRKHKILLAFAVVVIVLCVSINTFAAEGGSSFVTQSDGKSYPGLPDFPSYTFISSAQADFYFPHKSYLLLSNSNTSDYYLLCSACDVLYMDGDIIRSLGTYTLYNDSSLTQVYASNIRQDRFYLYKFNGESWVQVKVDYGDGYTLFNHADLLVQSSCDIYTDSNCTEVFTQSAAESLVAGLTSTAITEVLKSQVLGLVPSLVALLTCLVGFWMAWRILRKTLLAA